MHRTLATSIRHDDVHAGAQQQAKAGVLVDIESDGQRKPKAAQVSPAEKAYIEAFAKKAGVQPDKIANAIDTKMQHASSSPKAFTIKAVQDHDDRSPKAGSQKLSGLPH